VNTTIDIRPILPAEVDQVVIIQSECGLSSWTREAYLEEIRRPGSILLAAHAGREVSGFVLGRTINSEPPEAEIYNIGTRPVFRRLGIGSALLREFIKASENAGIVAIWLDVRSSNTSAISFYKRFGFLKSGIRRNFYTGPREDADVMVRRA
jgi:ribosomal-protein-alanine acetyltransferase